MRRSYGRALTASLKEIGADPASMRQILDAGCSTGRNSRVLMEFFPDAHFTGLDLSPHFLAVAQVLQKQRESKRGTSEPLSFVHGSMEQNPFPDESFDLVTISLVMHELPSAATREILKASWRVLRPGGILSVVDSDPSSFPFMQNPVIYAAFKSTEPWINQYFAFPVEAELQNAGFQKIIRKKTTPRHHAFTAIKL